jgi:hypothetical protein
MPLPASALAQYRLIFQRENLTDRIEVVRDIRPSDGAGGRGVLTPTPVVDYPGRIQQSRQAGRLVSSGDMQAAVDAFEALLPWGTEIKTTDRLRRRGQTQEFEIIGDDSDRTDDALVLTVQLRRRRPGRQAPTS